MVNFIIVIDRAFEYEEVIQSLNDNGFKVEKFLPITNVAMIQSEKSLQELEKIPGVKTAQVNGKISKA